MPSGIGLYKGYRETINMIFNSRQFILVFLPISILIYFFVDKIDKSDKRLLKKIFLICISLFFYGYTNKKYIVIILFSIIINFTIGKLIIKFNKLKSAKKMLLIIGLVFNIGLLGYFKYYNFFIENVDYIFKNNFNLINVILPVGISFFTFQQLAFVIDNYRNEMIHYNFIDYCLAVVFFPKLSEGPIMTVNEFIFQLDDSIKKRIDYDNMNKGLYMFAIGLGKKIFIADMIGRFADSGFAISNLSFCDAWLTSLAYTFQLYFDFSGYCDMAIGIALMFNIKVPMNFNSPYKSTDIQMFWRNWHSTLGKFLTKYLYIPLGGNRKGQYRTYLNIFIIFLVSGIWHGAGWTFIIWGMLHGISSIIHRIWTSSGKKLNKYLGIFITFNCVNIFWVVFRAKNISNALSVLRSMFDLRSLTKLMSSDYIKQINSADSMSIEGLLCILIIAIIITFLCNNSLDKVKNMRLNIATMFQIVVIIVCATFVICSSQTITSLYFNF